MFYISCQERVCGVDELVGWNLLQTLQEGYSICEGAAHLPGQHSGAAPQHFRQDHGPRIEETSAFLYRLVKKSWNIFKLR